MDGSYAQVRYGSKMKRLRSLCQLSVCNLLLELESKTVRQRSWKTRRTYRYNNVGCCEKKNKSLTGK